MNILNLDLDFFLHETVYHTEDSYNTRAEDLPPWDKLEVINFLENVLGLSKSKKIPGFIVESHHEVFNIWKKLYLQNNLNIPFNVIHIDAHADLGLGDSSWTYLLKNLLKFPWNQRISPKFGGNDGVSCGNYLSFAIANRWIKRLFFIVNEQWYDDIPPQLLTTESFYYWSNTTVRRGNHDLEIQLRSITESGINKILYSQKKFHDVALDIFEPKVPLAIRTLESIQNDFMSTEWQYIFLAKSPGYTPSTADYLIDEISEYIQQL